MSATDRFIRPLMGNHVSVISDRKYAWGRLTTEAVDSILNTIEDEAWLDIKSAPKDGTTIIVWTPEGANMVSWMGDAPPWHEDAHSPWWYVDGGRGHIYGLEGPAPTHWMPLFKGPEV